MIENGLYVIKRELLEVINELGGYCDIVNGNKRSVFCCLKDTKIDGLYWAIPTSDLSHRKDGQREYYQTCLACPDKDLRSCYYHIAKTTKDALYKISSCYPITEKYIDHPFISNNVHVVMKRQDDINEIMEIYIHKNGNEYDNSETKIHLLEFIDIQSINFDNFKIRTRNTYVAMFN